MQIGIIGLGKMGANMALRLIRDGHDVHGFDINEDAAASLTKQGGTGTTSLEKLVESLEAPKALWLSVPSGKIVDSTIENLIPLLAGGDVIVDSGNSNYKETLRRAEQVESAGIAYVDAGVSGGVWGLEGGYSMMVGGPAASVERLRPVFESLAPGPDEGWGHVGPVGSGHFVKMVHNGIEYGMMQAYAEGFAVMQAKEAFELDLAQVSQIWRFGSVVRSWLLDLAANALEEDASFEGIAPYVSDSGMGRWTVKEAIDLDVPAPVLTLALLQRLQSRDESSYAFKMLNSLRNQFGGHAIKRED